MACAGSSFYPCVSRSVIATSVVLVCFLSRVLASTGRASVVLVCFLAKLRRPHARSHNSVRRGERVSCLARKLKRHGRLAEKKSGLCDGPVRAMPPSGTRAPPPRLSSRSPREALSAPSSRRADAQERGCVTTVPSFRCPGRSSKVLLP